MRIAFVTSCLAPGLDGVGDYTRELALACTSLGHACALLALNDRHVSDAQESRDSLGALPDVLRLPAVHGWSVRLARARTWLRQWTPDAVSLQFVAYGFHPKGLIGALGARLRPLLANCPLELMMHELWIGLERDATLKRRVIGALQRRAVMTLVRQLEPRVLHTSNPTFAGILARHGVSSARVLPLFGGIPIETSIDPNWLGRALAQGGVTEPLATSRERTWRFGFFGSLHPTWSGEPFFSHVRETAMRTNRRVIMTSIGRLGPGEPLWQDLQERYQGQFSFAKLGQQSAMQVSTFLQSIDFGVATTPWQLIGKSGTTAAMLEHGLPVIATRDDQDYRVPGPFASDPLLHRMDDQLPQWLLTAERRAPRRMLLDITRDFLTDLTANSARHEALASPKVFRDSLAAP
jgi:hypothetical protein